MASARGDSPRHERVVGCPRQQPDEPCSSRGCHSRDQPTVTALAFRLGRLDYLLAVRVSTRAQRALLDEVARGAYRLEPFSAQDVASALVVVRSYPSLEIGLADASIVVLAERYGVLDVLTLDHRHFKSMRGLGGRRFRLLPAS